MAPTVANSNGTEMHSSYECGYKLSHPEPGEDVVITGLSGSYPDSANAYEFRDNLFNKRYLSGGTHRLWKLNNPEIPPYGGRIYDIEKFDASFFGIHAQQAHAMDPMVRILLEKVFEAVVDAGMHPDELRKTNTGVFVGACFSEAEKYWLYEQPGKFSMTGCIRSVIPYRVSQWLGVYGPSYIVDTACSSSMYALEHAYRAIRNGHCETAIVGGCNICLHPYVTLQFWRLGVLNADGKCKCFDESADGYTRSEAIVAIVLQKSKNARRIYAQIVHAKTNCDGYKEQGITYPSGLIQTTLLKEFYAECDIDPSCIEYIEAHGTGTRVGDPEEVAGIDTVFCKNRTKPLLIGSVKSNIGHTEPASGLCSITKAILAMESNCLIPNIHYITPRKEMDGIFKGRIQVLTEKMKWDGGYMPISSFGFGGANCHVLLKSNTKRKINNSLPRDDLPRLIYISGRTEEAVNNIIDDLKNRPLDAEYVRLLHEVFKYDISGHIYRGYATYTKEALCTREVGAITYHNKELWFIFSGLAAQWPGMGIHLMNIPIFAASVERCHQILSRKNVNITDIITSVSPNIHANMTNTLVGITVIQIGLVDLLTAIDLKPRASIGYSIGEIACAYFNKCLTLEQALLCSYHLGQCIDQLQKARGSMFAVNIGYEKIKTMLPPDIYVACNNAENNCILSGDYKKMKDLSNKLKESNVSVEELDTNGVPFHSVFMEEIGSALNQKLKQVIPEPKLRSADWLSTSVLNKNTHLSKYCSAEYLTNMILSTVFFEEIYNDISNNVISLEISPRGIMQNLLQKSEYSDSINIELLKPNANNTEHFLAAIGKLYIAGYNPRVENIYPEIKYPVSKGTPMLSPLIRWEHDQDWFVSSYDVNEAIKGGERVITIKLQYDEFEYLAGHVIDGRVLYPATGYLALVWETLALIKAQSLLNTSVVFENVKFLRATNIPKDSWLFLTVRIQKVSGNFEVVEGNTAIVTGRIFIPEDIEKEMRNLPIPVPEKKDFYVPLNSRDIYKELRLRGYNYSGLFRSLYSSDVTGEIVEIKWQNNFVAFMDNILQTQILQEDTRGLFVPTAIQRLVIDTEKHKRFIENLNENKTIPAYVYKNIRTIVCGGVEVRNLDATVIAKRKPLGEPVLETYKFIPHSIKNTLNLEQSVRVIVHLAFDNIPNVKVKTIEVPENNNPSSDSLLSPIVKDILADIPLIQADINVLTKMSLELTGINIVDRRLTSETNCLMVIVSNIIQKPQTLETTFAATAPDGFILSRENVDVDISLLPSEDFEIVQDCIVERERLLLIRKTFTKNAQNYIDLSNSSINNFEWIPVLQESMKNDPNTVAYAQGDYINGIIGLTNCIRKEPSTTGLRCVFVMDNNAPPFDPKNEFYSKQLRKGLAVNVYKNGMWGTYRHVLLDKIKNVPVEHALANVTVRADLSSLRWIEGSLCRYTNVNSRIVDVYYSALNFRDIMTATGRIAAEYIAKGRREQECVQGLEYSGKMADGRRVMGILHSGATATMVSADEVMTWDVPDEWSLQEAATVPCVYATVLFSFHICKMKPGMSILIHAGSGGVGQAAINIATNKFNATIFTTVGTPEKREFIKKNWPHITDEYIGNSRDISFVQMVMKQTKGRGVDIVINSLAEEKLLASVRCLAEGGRFLEIGKFDLSKDNPLPVTLFKKKCSFHGIMLDSLFTFTNVKKQILKHLLTDAIKNNFVKPLKPTVFQREQLEEAFRYMAAGKHMGKVLIQIREEEIDRNAKPVPIIVEAVPRFRTLENRSVIITGGLGGFGLELADWLIMRGAKKMVLNSRKGIVTGYQAMRMKIWLSYGIDVIISKDDITTYSGCKNLIETAASLGPVDCIFNLAVVLRDTLFENQTVDDFATSFGPKPVATKYLDELSRELCPELRQFVVFSSVSCGRGNAGQSNYGMANSIMERICEKRKEDGLPGIAIEWGAVGDVGLVAEMQEEHTEVVIGGTLQQRISSCLSTLDIFLKQDNPIVASMVVAEKKAGAGDADNIIDAVANILGIKDLKTISINASLAEVGMDSIMAVEIKQTLERDFEVFLTPQDIRSMTFARLQAIASEKECTSKPESSDANDVITNIGVFALIRAVGDEDSAKKPFIILPSQAPAGSVNRVILIPGIEGMSSSLEILALRLKAVPVCIQNMFTNPADTISGMAASMFQDTLDNISDHEDKFTIVGYSYGAVITLELVSLLEACGKVGRVILIDGSPEMLKEMAQHNFDMMSEESFQNSIIFIIISLVLNTEQVVRVKSLYEKCLTWNEKLDCILENRPKDMLHNMEFYRNFCDAFYNRIKAILKYEPQLPKLKSTIKLIKPKQCAVPFEKEDFGLSTYAINPIEIVYMEGNHLTLIENIECAEEINKVLQEKIVTKDSLIEKQPHVKYEAVIN